jgi:dihydrofolate reductase
MRNVIANEWTSLDGVMQAPGYPDEDTSGGFEEGGWHMPYMDDIARGWVVDGYAAAGGFLFGRKTYELLASYWPNASEEEQGVAVPLNTLPKYVASTTLSAPLGWEHAQLLDGDVADAVTELKRADGEDLHIVGSSELLQTLIAHDLVDGFRLMIDPLVLGRGKRVFGEGAPRRPLRLAESQVTTTGAIVATYLSAEG